MKKGKILLLIALLGVSFSNSGCKFRNNNSNTDVVTPTDNNTNTNNDDNTNTNTNDNTDTKTDTGDNNDTTTKTGTRKLRIISCNDFHGVVEADSSYPGISAFGAKIKSLYDTNPDDCLVLSAGDMFQGSGVSSLTKGKVVIDAMNYLKFDCMSIGNHEFDWGVDALRMAHDGITKDYDYNTKTVNPEANFPYLGCNIYYNNGTSDTSDDTFASDLAEPYTIIERNDVKVGVIGYIGTDQLKSICTTVGGQFSFHDPVSIVGEWAEYLRTEKGCDFIIGNAHDATDSTNASICNLSGNKKIDYLLNAHTHAYYVKQDSTNSQYIIQSGSYGLDIGYAEFKVDFDNDSVSVLTAPTNTYKSSYNSMSDATLTADLQKHLNLVAPVLNEVIGTVSSQVSKTNRNDICRWTSDCIMHQVGCDYGFTNFSGIRSSGFPIPAGDITVNTIHGVMPFDNVIVVGTMTGAKIKSLMSANQSYLGTSLNYDADAINSSTTYNVCFDEFSYGKFSSYVTNGQYTEYLVRDAMINEIRYQTSQNKSWTWDSSAAFPLSAQ